MECCFCRRPNDDFRRVNALYLCPSCLDQLLSVSPEDKTYRWYVSALRRELSRPAQQTAQLDFGYSSCSSSDVPTDI